jgi:hypothetical protein
VTVVLVAASMMCVETLPSYYYQPFTEAEAGFIAFFTLEFISRWWAQPSPRKYFLLSFINMVDVGVLVPFYLELIIGTSTVDLRVLRIVRIMRIFRLFKISRYVHGLQTIVEVATKSIDVVVVLTGCMALLASIFGTAVFYLEVLNARYDHNTQRWLRNISTSWNTTEVEESPYQSILDGLWWATATITTVGYGDVTPVTIPGRIAAGCCMVVGVLTLAIPAAVFSTNFLNYAEEFLASHRTQLAAEKGAKDTMAAEVIHHMDEIGQVPFSTRRAFLWNDAAANTILAAFARGARGGDLRAVLDASTKAYLEEGRIVRNPLSFAKSAKSRKKKIVRIKL